MTNIMSERARRMRKEKSPADRKLWRELRALNAQGFHFRQQAPIGPYIADFADLGKKLVIELDGSQHSEAAAIKKDERRTSWLNSQGYRVLRFWNIEVITNLNGVMSIILASLNVIPPTPGPSPQGGGESP
ncbi:MAG: endonuclease domain-containing protein [Hyphomicrobium sp.]